MSDDVITTTAKQKFGIDALFPYQRLVIAGILEAAGHPDFTSNEGVHLRRIVILPTGAGKSLCFQLPSLLMAHPTLIIFPLLSLLKDQERRLQEQNIASVLLQGGQSTEERNTIWNKLRNKEVHLILSNPETILSPAVLKEFLNFPCSHMVIDEAHCIPAWGKSFRPTYLRLYELAQKMPVVTAFTATASPDTLSGIRQHLFPDGCTILHGNPDRQNLYYSVVESISAEHSLTQILRGHTATEHTATAHTATEHTATEHTATEHTATEHTATEHTATEHTATEHTETAQETKPEANQVAARYLWQMGRAIERPVIIFASSRATVVLLARMLRSRLGEKNIFFYHAGLNKEEKLKIEDWFLHSSDGILCATCAYGMGVDKPNIRSVIHYEGSQSIESYVQEAGRAGRDRCAANAVLIWDQSKEQRKKGRGAEQMTHYARSTICRRVALLSLLGSECSVCFACDRCQHVQRPLEGKMEICKLVSHYPRRFRKRDVVQILSGSHSRCPRGSNRGKDMWKVLSDWHAQDLNDAINNLIQDGTLAEHSYWQQTLTKNPAH